MPLIGTLTSGISAMRSFTKGLEVIGNNIANVNTTGFKASTTSFADSFSNTLRASAPSGAENTNQSATQIGTGVRLSQISTRFTQGGLTTTGVPTDLAISGNGFFLVRNQTDGQVFATRSGEFRIDDQGYLVSTHGYRVQGLNGGSTTSPLSTALGDIRVGQNLPVDGGGQPIALQSFSIDGNGNLTEFYADGSSAITNAVQLQNYRDPSALQKQGDNLYTGFTAAGIIAIGGNDFGAPGSNGLGKVESGQIELSNVDLTEEFANMITTQRSFQASSRLVTISDQVLEEIVNLKR